MKPEKDSTAYRVEPFTEDHTGHLSWGLLGNQILRCAGMHADARGFGFKDMIRSNHVWVLARLVIEMDRMPATGEDYAIETWVTRVYRQFTDRLFSIQAPGADKPFGHAMSTWALIDMDTRRPRDLSTLPEGDIGEYICEEQVPIAEPSRVVVKAKEPVYTLTAGYSDLDVNGHVNSIRYLQMAMDLFSATICGEGRRVRRAEMAYGGESYVGDQLQFFTDGIVDNQAAVVIKRNGETVTTKITLVFE